MTPMQFFLAKLAGGALLGTLAMSMVRAQEVSYEVKDGDRYQVTRSVQPRTISETHYEPREYTKYREQYTTDLHESQRTYQVPVTEQQWVPGYQRTWNVFAPPVLTYRLMPVTRWETRSETVRVPVTRRDVIPETATQQVPVTTQRVVQDEVVHRRHVGSETSASAVARGSKLQNDPPR